MFAAASASAVPAPRQDDFIHGCCPDHDVAELVRSDDLPVGDSAEMKDGFGTHAVTGTWTSL